MEWDLIRVQELMRPVVRARRRPWRERLFSRPWRPWLAAVPVVEHVPDETIYLVNGRLVCHPVVAARLEAALAEEER